VHERRHLEGGAAPVTRSEVDRFSAVDRRSVQPGGVPLIGFIY